MRFILISVCIPLAAYAALPELARSILRRPPASRWPLALGGFLFFISWYVPSPLIQGQSTQFTTHFVGGGLFTGCVWLYLKKQAGRKLSVGMELCSLYALVSALGVANELFEWLAVQAKLIRLDPSDTWWDLLANTLGALAFWIIYRGSTALLATGTQE